MNDDTDFFYDANVNKAAFLVPYLTLHNLPLDKQSPFWTILYYLCTYQGELSFVKSFSNIIILLSVYQGKVNA